MKLIFIGGICVLSSTLLFGLTLVAAAVYALELSSTGYSIQFGLYGSALLEIGVVPILLSLIMASMGCYFFYQASSSKWKSKYFLVDDTEQQ